MDRPCPVEKISAFTTKFVHIGKVHKVFLGLLVAISNGFLVAYISSTSL